jgi:proteasome lid subunit RPN8/RPN11
MSALTERHAPSRMRGKVRSTDLPLMRRPPDPDMYLAHETADGRRVFVARRVLGDLAELERADHPDETGGLLFGGFFTDGANPCTIVNELVKPEPGEVIGSRASVTITAAGSERMIARAWLRDPLLRPVGWGHTHPTFEAYFSSTDRAEQQRWREPASVGLVLSGLVDADAPYRVFVGPESEPADPLDDLPLVLPAASRADGHGGRGVIAPAAPLQRPLRVRVERRLRESAPVATAVAAILGATLAGLAFAEAHQAHLDAAAGRAALETRAQRAAAAGRVRAPAITDAGRAADTVAGAATASATPAATGTP